MKYESCLRAELLLKDLDITFKADMLSDGQHMENNIWTLRV